MVKISRHDFTTKPDKTLSYLDAGPRDGPLLIFIHGWPAIASTWTSQLTTFAGLGFHVVAPDMPGYGQSYKTKDKSDYSMQNVVTTLLSLLKHLERHEAVWIGHDWGASVVWAFLAHHPEFCTGVINMCIPYRMLEMGVDELIKYANRDVYPEDKYPNAQWDYQVFYQDQANLDKAIAFYESDVESFLKAIYRPMNPAGHNKPAMTATVCKDGGWFGGADKPPETPLQASLLDEQMLKDLGDAFRSGGFWAPTAYYLNHELNHEWAEDWSVNEGIVSIPTLFIEALHDHVAGTYNSTVKEPMQSYCRKHTEVSIEAGHWVAMEEPEQVNAAIARWILTAIPSAWPFEKKMPLKRNE